MARFFNKLIKYGGVMIVHGHPRQDKFNQARN